MPGKRLIDHHKNECAGNVVRSKESITIVKSEFWSSSLVQEEKYQEKHRDKRK
jgi:hypothetical protein